MGGKSKQSQRTKNNVRPSSSGRSAELLNNAVRVDPNAVTTSGGKVLPVLFPTLATPIDASLNPEFILCLKKLNKKDPITKTKALQELQELVQAGDKEGAVAALPAWAHAYRALSTDNEHKVREAAQVTHGAMMCACGRRVAPQLKQLLPPWLQAQHDEYAPAAAAARASLTKTFPEGKLPDVMSFCMTEVMAYLLENLMGNVDAILNKKNLKPEDKDLQHTRLVTASLQGLEFFTQHLPAAHDDWLWAELTPMLQAPTFWKLPSSKAQQIKTAWYGALGRIIARFKERYGPLYGQKTAGLLLAGCGGAALWSCVLVLMHHVQDWHTWVDNKALLMKRILDVLENGGWGDAKHLSSLLLPLLANLPDHMLVKEFYEAFFNAMFKGLAIKGVISSKSERQCWLSSLAECLQYLSVQQKDYAVEVTTSVHRTWLEKVLVNFHDAQTTNNLIKHSATCMVSLLKYWLKSSRETNEDKYDQLVRNFWQNVTVTMVTQIDWLSTDREQVANLIDVHTLMLQSLKTLFLHDAKKSKSIKFNDEQQAKPEKPVDAMPQFDAATVERFQHNLNDVVHKICAKYFEYAHKKEMANNVFSPLLTLIIEFDDKNLFVALANQFEADSAYGLYDKVLRGWLASDTMRCKGIVDVVFLSMKHLSEDEQKAVLDSFKQFPPSVVEWCISLALSHPHCTLRTVRRWLRGNLVTTTLKSVCQRMISEDDSRSRSLLLMCLAHDSQGEIMISSSCVDSIVALVSRALRSDAPALEGLASAAAALACELDAAGAELALPMFQLQLTVPRGSAQLSADTWLEVRGAWQCAGAGSASFRRLAIASAREMLRLGPNNLHINIILNTASLCTYLLPQLCERDTPTDLPDAVSLITQLFKITTIHDRVITCTLRTDCIRSKLNCPFDDDSVYIEEVIEQSSKTDLEEMSRVEIVAFSRELLFRTAVLKNLFLHRGEGEAWGAALLEEHYFREEFGKVLYDYAVLCSLYEGYAFWSHYDVIDFTKSRITTMLDDIIAELPSRTRSAALTHLATVAAQKGYYWSYAKTIFEARVRGIPKIDDDDDDVPQEAEKSERDRVVNLEKIVTGNGFFHTLQAETSSSRDPAASLSSKYLVMMRSYYLAHVNTAVIDDTFLETAAHGSCDPDAIIDAYYRHQHTMLYDSDISSADWRQVVSNAAIVDYLTEMVDARGWDAPAQHWDFTAITLCSLTAALHNSVQHWGCTKVALLARAVFALFRSVQRFVGSVKSECVKREPLAHVAELPTEWNDIFAPDLHYNLFSIVVKVLESRAPITAPRAAFIQGLLETTRRLDWHALPHAHQASLSVRALLLLATGTLAAPPSHHAYAYLAHALLQALRKPLVIHDAEALAAWLEASKDDDEGAPRVSLLLGALLPPLTHLQELVHSALSAFKVGEDTCEMVPGTDSHGVALAYLLLIDNTLAACQLAKHDLVHHYLELFRETKHAQYLLTAALRLLPPGVAAHALDQNAPLPAAAHALFLTPRHFTLDEPSSALDVGALSCRGLWAAARWLGGAVRGWWGAAGPRAARALERLLAAAVSPALVKDQLTAVARGAHSLEDAEVIIHQSTREVVCRFLVEERTLELNISLGASHPLPPPRVTSPAINTHWITVYLAYQNGTVLEALRMWMATVARRVEAAPHCYICYCRLHPASGRLPRVPCHQCRNKFHAECLRKWFTTSSKSNCPLCRATF